MIMAISFRNPPHLCPLPQWGRGVRKVSLPPLGKGFECSLSPLGKGVECSLSRGKGFECCLSPLGRGQGEGWVRCSRLADAASDGQLERRVLDVEPEGEAERIELDALFPRHQNTGEAEERELNTGAARAQSHRHAMGQVVFANSRGRQVESQFRYAASHIGG